MELENILLVITALLILPLIYRLWRGPSVGDRLLALEVMGGLGVLVMVILTLISARPIYIDVAILLALFSFLGTLVIARYMERGLI